MLLGIVNINNQSMEEKKMDQTQNTNQVQGETKFCSECGQKIAKKAVVCPHCGCQVESLEKKESAQPQIIINNSNQNQQNQTANNVPTKTPKNKWTAFVLCLLLGWLGAHKFYEGKTGMGILYLFSWGLFGVGVIIDLIALLGKPNPYYV